MSARVRTLSRFRTLVASQAVEIAARVRGARLAVTAVMSIVQRLIFRRRIALRFEKAYIVAIAIIATAVAQLAT